MSSNWLQVPIAQYSAEELQARLKLALKELKATQRSLEDATALVSKLRYLYFVTALSYVFLER